MGDSESFLKFVSDLRKADRVKNGVISNGVLAWVDIQVDTTADGVSRNLMDKYFTPEEVEEAVTVLWASCGGQGSVLGEYQKRKNVPTKKKNQIDDIFNAFKKFDETGMKPIFLVTSDQLKQIRPYNISIDSQNDTKDILERFRLLEECIGSQNNSVIAVVGKMDEVFKKVTPAP